MFDTIVIPAPRTEARKARRAAKRAAEAAFRRFTGEAPKPGDITRKPSRSGQQLADWLLAVPAPPPGPERAALFDRVPVLLVSSGIAYISAEAV